MFKFNLLNYFISLAQCHKCRLAVGRWRWQQIFPNVQDSTFSYGALLERLYKWTN